MATVAIAVGVSLIGSFITNALTPKPQQQNNLDDLSVLKSELGVPIPKVFGRHRVTGNVFWAQNIKAETESSDGGGGGKGGGGGGGGGSTTYYYGTFATLLCEGPVAEFGKIWLNNRLVYNPNSDNPTVVDESNKFRDDHMTFYYGDLTQVPDPIIQSFEGVANVPAFRKRAYIVFNDLELSKYGNAVPKVEVEIFENVAGAGTTVGNILTYLEDLAKLPSGTLDISTAVQDIAVDGYYFSQGGVTFREVIEDLQKLYQFTIVDNGANVLVRGVEEAETINIPEQALATVVDGESPIPRYEETTEKIEDLPSTVEIEYDNKNNDYNRGVQTWYDSRAEHVNTINFKTKAAISDSEAQSAVARLITYYWQQRRYYKGIRLPIRYFNVKPGDILRLPVRGQQLEIQLDKVTRGSNFILEAEGVSYNNLIPTIDIPSDNDDNYNPPEDIPFVGNPFVTVIDTNLVRDTDSDIGIYASPLPEEGATWIGGQLFATIVGGTFESFGSMPIVAARGVLTSDIPDGNGFVVNKGTFELELKSGSLVTVPELDFYNFKQMFYVNGELIVFRVATLTGPGVYQISEIVRGARGTEHMIQSHPAGSSIFLIKDSDDFESFTGTSGLIGSDIEFKAVPTNATESDITNITTLTPFENKRSFPYSAATDLRMARIQATSDLRIDWQRRTRKDGDWQDITTPDVPLNEDTETYDLEITDGIGNAAIRTANGLTTPTYTYTSADQITDFGVNQTQIVVRIYQISATTGRGYVREELLLTSRVE